MTQMSTIKRPTCRACGDRGFLRIRRGPASGPSHLIDIACQHDDAARIPIIVFGVAGCGKTRNAELLRKMLGCSKIVDSWEPGQRLVDGALHLTNAGAVREAPFIQAATVLEYDNLVYGDDFQ